MASEHGESRRGGPGGAGGLVGGREPDGVDAHVGQGRGGRFRGALWPSTTEMPCTWQPPRAVLPPGLVGVLVIQLAQSRHLRSEAAGPPRKAAM